MFSVHSPLHTGWHSEWMYVTIDFMTVRGKIKIWRRVTVLQVWNNIIFIAVNK